MGTAVLLECYIGFVHVGYDSSCSYVFVHFVNDTQMNMYSCHRHSHSSNECFKNISVMNINVNNEFKSCAAGTMGGKTRTLILSAFQMLSFGH